MIITEKKNYNTLQCYSKLYNESVEYNNYDYNNNKRNYSDNDNNI